MKLTIWVDAQFYKLKDSTIDNMKKTFVVQQRENPDGQRKIHVWLSSSEKTVDDVDLEIQDFLRSIQTCGFDETAESVLRVAIFYKLSETIIFPFSISSSTIRLLADCGMSLETVGYPCSDDRPPSSDVL
ncbi:hypothetical protein VOM14_00590 [Paraburkholderia sp. MPAMCS5]|uniref:hypothetical protein n=1 Tax=Paraburkholderia sp. MPAMCS5 TaxID=3112563 RepID=UPI002E189F45|nr:hypothetical protein [Paraburkholderia sp. MPAMCS5]